MDYLPIFTCAYCSKKIPYYNKMNFLFNNLFEFWINGDLLKSYEWDITKNNNFSILIRFAPEWGEPHKRAKSRGGPSVVGEWGQSLTLLPSNINDPRVKTHHHTRSPLPSYLPHLSRMKPPSTPPSTPKSRVVAYISDPKSASSPLVSTKWRKLCEYLNTVPSVVI